MTLAEYRSLYDHFKNPENRWTKTKIKDALKFRSLKFISGREEIKAIKEVTSGRSAFSRVSVRQILEMLWEGYSPSEFKDVLLKRPISLDSNVTIKDNKDPSKGLVASDLKWLEEIKDCTWDNFYLPQVKYKNPYEKNDSRQAITELFSNVNDPVIRHRLSMLGRTIDEMAQFISKTFKKSAPDNVCLELVRDDFLSEKKKKEIQAVQLKNQKDNERVKKKVAELKLDGEDSIRKYKLWEKQGKQCIYTGASISLSQLNSDYCDVDHIIPRAMGGTNNFWNLALTTRHVNQNQKMRQTPYQWLSSDPVKWREFCLRVASLKNLDNKTKRLLLEPNYQDFIEKTVHLAETAYMAKLAVHLINLKFGWLPHTFGEQRKVITVRGNVTAMVRGWYDLDAILKTKGNQSDSKNQKKNEKNDIGEAKEKKGNKKNRKDDRHHMLDAMILCYLPHWINEKDKRNKFELPRGIDKDYFARLISEHKPYNFIISDIDATFYGKPGQNLTSQKKKLIDCIIEEIAVEDLLKKEPHLKEFNLSQFGLKAKSLITTVVKSKFNKFYDKIRKSDQIDKGLSEYLGQLEGFIKNISDEEILSQVGKTKLERFLQMKKLGNGTTLKKIKIKFELPKEFCNRQSDRFAPAGYIKPGEAHKGFYICTKIENTTKKQKSSEPSWEAIAVYAWESRYQKEAKLKAENRKVYCFVRSGDYIEVRRPIGDKINIGFYKLRSIQNGGTFVVSDPKDPDQKYASLNVGRYVTEGQFIPVEAGAEIHL